MTNVCIRQLIDADVAHAAEILSVAFGSSPWDEGLRRHLALQPEGMLLAEQGGWPVGMVCGVDYGPFAYVGPLGVRPEAQRRGVAQALMIDLLAWLEHRGTPAALLDATPLGAPLYERLGFHDAGTSYLAVHEQPTTPGPLPEQVMTLEPAELDALAAFDAPFFGVERRAVLASLLSAHPGRVLVTRDAAGTISGYVVAQARIIGPWVAPTPVDAERLLRAALARAYEQPPRVLVPADNPGAVALLQAHEFVVRQELRHMQRGELRRAEGRSALYGQVSFALG